MDDLSRFRCLNVECVEHGKRGAGNLVVCGRSGGTNRLLRCRRCQGRFSERKGTALFRAHLPADTVASILAHVTEGVGMRKTGRLVGVKEDTVIRYARLAGATTPKASTTRSWLFPPATRDVPLDEKWSFVHTKEKNCDPDDPADARRGDNWDHVAVDAEHRLVLCTVPGKRSAEHVQEPVDDVKRRIGGRVPRLITADEYAPYKQAILNAYGTRVVPPRTGKPGRPATKGRLVPPPELNFATVHKTRAEGRVVDVALVIVFGVAAAVAAALGRFTVNASRVERQNGTDRNRNARKVRRTCCFSSTSADFRQQRSATELA